MKGFTISVKMLVAAVIAVVMAFALVTIASDSVKQVKNTEDVSNGTVECVLDAQKAGTNPEVCEQKLPRGKSFDETGSEDE